MTDKIDAQEALAVARNSIDALTLAVAHLAGERTLWALKAGEAKTALDRGIVDSPREADVLSALCDAEIPGLDEWSKGQLAATLIKIGRHAQEAQEIPAPVAIA